ncbi:MAG: riboflavin biosynthesis protein RibF [Candidatus Omnitrophica bacterium]|nr:riboflavin biosynthesis protein RibF [Candidatus Omnitrophota bacterium]MBU4302891.1 riboflavin biosynthesis protein RibF [Candidatus Omnitrophota bacterium]MBU4418582.1 riboflavin biosynthesis protein RibF [Candidatus Omnitrophota bacterium]MBU4468354.1 riboflavin biosynthesis protein RibF [Candidatus Omnitrophota bacterium]MCG2707601.1 riboflavin biosynthesis protein RibF [Candidatus Omnitrophota bacterium]
MKIIYGVEKIGKLRRPVVALGVFDGLHLGHRNILQAVVKKARQIKGTSLVLTFFPHPQGKESLYSLEHRLRLIAELGLDVCIVVNFSRGFAKTSAVDFIAKILVEKIGANFVYVGRNFRFGNQARGDYRLLAKSAKKYKFGLKIFNVVKSAGVTVSSTAIRKLIKNSKIKEAERLLGRRVSILGTVERGSRLGRLLGFPTANIKPHHEVIPPAGIYAVGIVFSKKKYNGVCYIGKRPTLHPENKAMRIEVHIFNFHKNIYGLVLEIQFIKLIRLDQKFASLKDLSAQIQKDIISCRKIL